jgi:hypothetical protein
MTVFGSPVRPVRQRALRGWLVAALLLLVPVCLILLVVQRSPRVVNWTPPDGSSAGQARAVAERLHELMDGGDLRAGWGATEAEMNGVLASAGRLVPGLRGRASIEADRLAVDLSVGAPLFPPGLWGNVQLAFADSDDGLEIAAAQVGGLPLPPTLVERALRYGIDLALGSGAGDMALDSVAALALAPGQARLSFRVDADGRVPLLELLRNRARGAAGTDAREFAAAQLYAMQAGVERGRLPRDGSFLPYLRFALRVAGEQSGPERERVRGALYALALYCGDRAFETVVGVWLPSRMRDDNGCGGTLLGDRDDLRKHFVISAGLDAATSSTAAFGVGELKELLDTTGEGTGFSFDDMAADAAGVRFARTVLATPPAGWAALADRIVSEEALLPPLADLPTRLTADEFQSRYGSVDSEAYAALVTEIDRRVDALALHHPDRF